MAVRSRKLTDVELDAFAKSHLRYEVAMMVAQACCFHKRYPDGMPPADGFKDGTIDDALLEVTLVHLRLLDEFLASRGNHRCDVRANDWVPEDKWSPPTDWLGCDVRQRINWQVAHMSLCRDSWFDWDIRGYAYACCEQLDSFIGAVGAHGADRVPAFQSIKQSVDQGLACLSQPRDDRNHP